jgi:hypothetical protein
MGFEKALSSIEWAPLDINNLQFQVRETLLVVSIMPLPMVIESASNLMHVVGSQPLPNLKPFFPSFHSPSHHLVSHLCGCPFFSLLYTIDACYSSHALVSQFKTKLHMIYFFYNLFKVVELAFV